jgi:hypothetical protein
VGTADRGTPGPAGAGLPGRRLLAALVALVQQARADGEIAVRYIQCDDCDGPTPHHTEIQIFSATPSDPVFVGAPPEVICAVCCSVHPRVVGDEPPRDTPVTCAARRRPGLWLALGGLEGRLPRVLSGACAHRFAVPAAASVIMCRRCASFQPGPAASRPGSRAH